MINGESKKAVNKEKHDRHEKRAAGHSSGEDTSKSDINNPKKHPSSEGGGGASKSKKHHTKDNSELERIEQLCKEFGVPDPGELYVVPRDFEASGDPNITQYDMKMPEGLARWIDEAEYEFTVGQINSFRSITYYSMKYFLDHEDEVQLSDSDGHMLAHSHDDPPLMPAHLQARGSVMSHF